MNNAEKMRFLEAIVTAMDDASEARQELRERQSEYTGYSPSWALRSWIEAEQRAKERLMAALDGYIDYIVSERFAGMGKITGEGKQ